MLAYAAHTIAGVIIGAITSMIPGIHINTIAAIFLGALYQYGLAPEPLAFIILGMAVSHAFVGFLPSIFLGAPSEATVLSVAPAHRMLLKGKGYEALLLSIAGGLAGIIFLAILFPILAKIIPAAYTLLRPSIHYVLLISVAFLIFKEKKKRWALFVFLLAGAFGIIALSSGINSSFVLLPVLSGLFGISTMALSYSEKAVIPKQSKKAKISINKILPGSLRGLLGGLIAGILPGIGSSQSAIIAAEFTRQKGTKGFMVMLGAISATDILFSILAINLIGNPRSGAAVAIDAMVGSELDMKATLMFMGAGIFASGIAALITLRMGSHFVKLISIVDYKHAVIVALCILFAVIWHFTGLSGIIIALTGAAIGAIPGFTGTKKSLLLGCLILPTMLYFFGIALL